MIAKAELRYIRITPRKFRQVIPLVRGKDPEVAMAILAGVKKNASGYAIELLKSALANAKFLHKEIAPSDMRISRFVANCGPQLKRFRAASMGRASTIRKRTSHIIVELDVVQQAERKVPEIKAKAKEINAESKVKSKKAKGKTTIQKEKV